MDCLPTGGYCGKIRMGVPQLGMAYPHPGIGHSHRGIGHPHPGMGYPPSRNGIPPVPEMGCSLARDRVPPSRDGIPPQIRRADGVFDMPWSVCILCSCRRTFLFCVKFECSKKVLLHEYKRHTTCHVSSTPSAVLSWGLPYVWMELPHPCTGVPIRGWG